MVITKMEKEWCETAPFFNVIGNCDAISYYIKTLREDAHGFGQEFVC